MALVCGFSKRQVYIFCLGWVGYASTYFLRKPLGVVKSDMQQELKLSPAQLGWLDTALILPYAVLQMVLGSLGDRLGAGLTFGICLVLDTLSMLTFGWWSNYNILFLLLFLNGAFQSICWPNAAKVMASWFTGTSKSSVFGVFGTAAFGGSFLGTTLAVYLQFKYGWRSAFLLPSLLVGSVGCIVILTFRECPSSSQPSQSVSHRETDNSCDKVGGQPWWTLWRISLVPELAVGAFSIKVVRYAVYGWMPMYLYQHLKYTKAEAGIFSTMFDVGGVVGSAAIGIVIDRLFSGQALRGCFTAVLMSTVCLGLFTLTANEGIMVNSVLMLLAGAFNCGPDTILASQVTTELGSRNGRNAAAAVTGFVNGFGSLGSVVQGPVVGLLLAGRGWNSVLLFLVLASTLGTFVIFRATQLAQQDDPPKYSDGPPVFTLVTTPHASENASKD